MDRYAQKNRKSDKGLTPLAMDMLLKYHWPGNVRELENAVERAVILLTGNYLTEKELPPPCHGRDRPMIPSLRGCVVSGIHLPA